MYCVKCGVDLDDSEKKCPLCGTVVYHPDIQQGEGEDLFPKNVAPKAVRHNKLLPAVIMIMFILPIVIVLLCDLRYSGHITWSGIVIGAIIAGYVTVGLPLWFRKPNPVIFIPCAGAAIGVYLLYINLSVGGDWFLSFAFPVVGGVTLIVTTVATLVRYVGRGYLYIYGGAFTALGGFMLLMEFLMCITFESVRFVGWSIYPLTALVLLGGLLIFLAICRPAKESMERKFFI